MTTQKHNKKKFCIVCKKELIIGKNWYYGREKSRNYICKKCDWIRTKPKRKDYNRRRTILKTNKDGTKTLLLGDKRVWTGYCELCKRKELNSKGQKIRFYYHHWEDENLLKGLWVCNWCHHFIHKYEQGYAPKWLKIKKKIMKEIKTGGK